MFFVRSGVSVPAVRVSGKPAFTERVCVLDYRTYLVFENKGLRVFGNAGVL